MKEILNCPPCWACSLAYLNQLSGPILNEHLILKQRAQRTQQTSNLVGVLQVQCSEPVTQRFPNTSSSCWNSNFADLASFLVVVVGFHVWTGCVFVFIDWLIELHLVCAAVCWFPSVRGPGVNHLFVSGVPQARLIACCLWVILVCSTLFRGQEVPPVNTPRLNVGCLCFNAQPFLRIERIWVESLLVMAYNAPLVLSSGLRGRWSRFIYAFWDALLRDCHWFCTLA